MVVARGLVDIKPTMSVNGKILYSLIYIYIDISD
jgi:hypothetical protein